MPKSSRRFAIALVTAPNLSTARRLAKLALRKRLAACANLIPRLESHYWWRGKLESAREVLIVFKTTAATAADLEALVVQEHPYDTPEFILLSIDRGNKRYLRWWEEALQP